MLTYFYVSRKLLTLGTSLDVDAVVADDTFLCKYEEDLIFVSELYILKGYGAKRLVNQFPSKDWKVRSLNKLLLKLRETGTTDRQIGSR